MKIYNTLSRKVETFEPLRGHTVHMYSCGPTVYDHIHVGNLSAFIAADMLRRALTNAGYTVKHVMNFTDVNDKIIVRSQERFPDLEAHEAMLELTRYYSKIFLHDMLVIGNSIDDVTFVKATEYIAGMQKLIQKLYKEGFAYLAGDGVYFSIEQYRKSGKKYGQLTEVTAENTSQARIQNDEYDKESAHDFALWKLQKSGEPAWEFELDGHNLIGRPGWHIECSVMSTDSLGLPFDIHTGGVDLVFPHHENEIAQSTAGQKNPIYAKYFVHNEHLLVDGRKMSKSLNNFHTLRDIIERSYDPLAFRLMILQAHYRSQSNFTWDNLTAAQNRLNAYRAMAAQQWQTSADGRIGSVQLAKTKHTIINCLEDDLNTPEALAVLSQFETAVDNGGINADSQGAYQKFLKWLDETMGLSIASVADISAEEKDWLQRRQTARNDNDWHASDQIREELKAHSLEVHDTPRGQIWSRLY